MYKLFEMNNLIKGKVIKRPSSSCKTPYVADVELEDGTLVLAHTTSLGCCGYADAGATVLMIPVENKKNVCKFKILLSKHIEKNQEINIGIDTGLPEKIVKLCIENNCISSLSHVKQLSSQVSLLHSRFDFAGIDKTDTEFVLEVKNVPLADYVDCAKKDRKKYDTSTCKFNEKISYFPDGYRKKVKDTISPRALKHVQELHHLKKTTHKRTILCYVIQRTDVSSFQPSLIDPIYRNAVMEAYKSGVEILPIVIEWTSCGQCYFVCDDLPINVCDKVS